MVPSISMIMIESSRVYGLSWLNCRYQHAHLAFSAGFVGSSAKAVVRACACLSCLSWCCLDPAGLRAWLALARWPLLIGPRARYPRRAIVGRLASSAGARGASVGLRGTVVSSRSDSRTGGRGRRAGPRAEPEPELNLAWPRADWVAGLTDLFGCRRDERVFVVIFVRTADVFPLHHPLSSLCSPPPQQQLRFFASAPLFLCTARTLVPAPFPSLLFPVSYPLHFDPSGRHTHLTRAQVSQPSGESLTTSLQSPRCFPF